MSDHVATVQSIYAAFGRGDIPAILDHLAEDVEWEHDWGGDVLPLFQPRKGRAAVPGFFGELQALDITRFEPVNLLTGGNQVVAVIRFGATARATGRKIDDLEAHLWTFGADGKVSAFRHIVDTRQQGWALGA
ncbi:MAG: nuclear transport factor 2 family protein [Gemmobacter sp.]